MTKPRPDFSAHSLRNANVLADFVVEVAHVFVLPTQPKLPHSLGTGGAVLQVGVAKTTEHERRTWVGRA